MLQIIKDMINNLKQIYRDNKEEFKIKKEKTKDSFKDKIKSVSFNISNLRKR